MSLFSKIVSGVKDAVRTVTSYQVDQVKQGAQIQLQRYLGGAGMENPAAAAALSRVATGSLDASSILNRQTIEAGAKNYVSAKLNQAVARHTGGTAMPQRDVIVGPGGGGMSLPGGYTARPAMGSVMNFVAGVVRSVTGKIIAFVTSSGVRITRKKAVALAREYGPTAAAAALGVTAADVMEAIVTESQSSKRRRRRGITARDLATAKRTINTIKRMSVDIGIRRASCRR